MDENYLINVADLESNLRDVIIDTIRLARKINRPVIAYLHGTGCLITGDISLNEGISRYQQSLKYSSRERE